ncbi:MAG: hypothetical protein P1U65_06595 [Minwuia sp.]|nr:hypothetical protein [Minwuia sp.]
MKLRTTIVLLASLLLSIEIVFVDALLSHQSATVSLTPAAWELRTSNFHYDVFTYRVILTFLSALLLGAIIRFTMSRVRFGGPSDGIQDSIRKSAACGTAVLLCLLAIQAYFGIVQMQSIGDLV